MFRRLFLAVFLVLLASASPLCAQDRYAPPAVQGRYAPPSAYNVQRLDRILPGIRAGRPGRFYDADGPFADGVGGWHYRIKWLTPEGRMVFLDADARSGRVLGPYRGYGPALVLPPAGLRYYALPAAPRPGFRSRFGWWGPHARWRGR